MKTRWNSIVLMVGLVLSLSAFAGSAGIGPSTIHAASCPTEVIYGCNMVGSGGGIAGWQVENQSNVTNSSGMRGYASATSGYTRGVYGQSDSTVGSGLYGYASDINGANFGVYGLSYSHSGIGVSGRAGATSGYTYGVWGETPSTSGRGVIGKATAATGGTYGVVGQSDSNGGRGVYGIASATSGGTNGVYGQANATGGIGVNGYASATTGGTIGVNGRSDSNNGTGVLGYVTETSGPNEGVYGRSDSVAGTGVQGYASAASGSTYGVYGSSHSTTGTGVYGAGTYGVYGQTTSSGGAAIYGSSDGGGDAGYFKGHVTIDRGVLGQGALNVNGDVAVLGILSGYLKLFRIDHPLDPANKYLNHVSVESPDMKNIYDGVAVLDSKGMAVVELPAYFEALNKDFRYQLTAIGAPGPHLYIAEEIQGNHFTIDGGKPNTKVSWQVTGIRHDAWAAAHPMPVEQDKPAEQRGLYLTPKEQGQPESKGVNYAREQQMTANQPQAPVADQPVPASPTAQ